MIAYNIKWDTDDIAPEELDLPTEIEIPPNITDEDEISDYISDITGFCHYGFELSDALPDGFMLNEPKKYKNKALIFKIPSIIIRLVLIIASAISCRIYEKTLASEIANKLAIQQMSNTADSSTQLYNYSRLMNYLWLVPVILTFLLFLPEIIRTIKTIIHNTRKDIKSHEKKS